MEDTLTRSERRALPSRTARFTNWPLFKCRSSIVPSATISSFLRRDRTPVRAYLGLGTFAQATVVPDSAAVAIPKDVPFRVATLIGCAVTTGVGAVTNTARVHPGESVVVLGCGGVGQAIQLGSSLVGVTAVIAVELSDERLAHPGRNPRPARRRPGPGRVRSRHHRRGCRARLRGHRLTRNIELLPQLVGRGGQAVVVGMPAEGARVVFDPFDLADQGKRIFDCNYGSSVPSVGFPRLARLYTSGRLPLDRLVGRTITLDAVDEALEDLGRAVGLRTVLTQTEEERPE